MTGFLSRKLWAGYFLGLVLGAVALLCLQAASKDSLAYQRITLIPLVFCAAWFFFNGLKLSKGLNQTALFFSVCEYFLLYGKLGLMPAFYLTLIITHLGARGVRPETKAQKLFCCVVTFYLARALFESVFGPDDALYSTVTLSGFALSAWLFFCLLRSDSQRFLPGNGFIILMLCFFASLNLIYRHEFIYIYKSDPDITLYPEWLTAQYFSLAAFLLLKILRLRYAGKLDLAVIILIFAAFLELPSYNPLGLDFRLADQLSRQPLHRTLFGWGYQWKYILKAFSDLPLYQFDVSLFEIVILEGGIALGLALCLIILFSWLGPGHTKRIIIIGVVALGFYLPVLRDPLGLFLAAALLAPGGPGLRAAQPYLLGDRLFGRALRLGFLIAFSYIGYQAAYCAVRIIQGPRVASFNSDYEPSRPLVLALLAAEDSLFFHHAGLDFKRLKEAALQTLEEGRYLKGGSSISMQLAKVRYLSFEKSFTRKIRQMILSLYLELRLSKSEILKEYLASIDYAPGTFGIVDAASDFYNKRPEQLNLHESVRIVMSIPDPGRFNALSPLDQTAKRNQDQILKRAAEFHFMLKKDFERSKL